MGWLGGSSGICGLHGLVGLWVAGWLICFLVCGLIGWLVCGLVDGLIYTFVCSFVGG